MAYQRILQLTYVEDLLAALKTLFVKYFEPFIAAFVASLHAINSAKITALEATSWDFAKAFEGWDTLFDKLLRGLEDKAAFVRYRSHETKDFFNNGALRIVNLV